MTFERRPDAVQDLAGALHEVSNALTVVLGWAEAARGTTTDATIMQRALDVIVSRARLGRDIVRSAIGAEIAAEEERSVGELIRDATLGLEPVAAARGVLIHAKIDALLEAPPVGGNAALIQILTNLLLNAVSMTPPESAVRLEARANGESAMITVVDEGPGIDEGRRATLFTEGSTTRRGGAGIGLVHAAALAREHGGLLSLVDSPRGAKFELSWPLDRAAGASRRPPARHSLLAGTRVLLLEDDEAVIGMLDTALVARGAEVVTARDRAGLAAVMASGRFDAALIDLSPVSDDVSGAIAAVTAANPSMRLVFISGSIAALPDDVANLAAAWVRKPFEIGEIVDAIARR